MRFLFHLCLIFIFSSCSMTTFHIAKVNGVSFVSSRDSISEKHVQPILSTQANYTAIMPFGFISDLEHPELHYDSDRQWFGETRQGVRQYISTLKKSGFNIMLKPQIWVFHGSYTGHIEMKNEPAWQEFEKTYKAFILDFAMLAEEMQVSIFCIGTELEKFVQHRPDYWFELISAVKSVYTGKLTYAANWDEYTRTPFWSQLDYIGIDAYFPVSNMQTPTVEDCLIGWKSYHKAIEKHSETYNKPVLFTEFGYRSVDFSAKEPWKSDRSMTATNMQAQVNATEALFETFWQEDWFVGGFLWKWFHDYENSGGANNNQFTPQNKPVEAVIKSYYKTFK